MKKIFLFLSFFWICWFSAWAAVDQGAVRLVSYEQSWTDSKGTLALKNNTEGVIRSVKFRITYTDMQGNPLDYEDFNVNVKINPGMVKKVNIRGYESDRLYSYYKSEGLHMNAKFFKIKFELLDYAPRGSAAKSDKNLTVKNAGRVAPSSPKVSVPVKTQKTQAVQKTQAAQADDVLQKMVPEEVSLTEQQEVASYFGFLEADYLPNLILLWILFSLAVVLYLLVAFMALKRGRSVGFWLVASIVLTPLLAMLLLMMMGDQYKENPYINEPDQN